MEEFIFRIIYKKILQIKKYSNKKIIIAGLTYKPNVADLRNSLAIKIFKKLKKKISNIKAFDPLINEKLAKKLNIENKFENIKQSDIFIFLVKHDKFKKIYNHVKKNNKTILDPFS